jgi:hypothetical protein
MVTGGFFPPIKKAAIFGGGTAVSMTSGQLGPKLKAPEVMQTLPGRPHHHN